MQTVTGRQEENIEDIIHYFAISLFGQNTVDDILWDLTKNCISKLGFEDCVIYLLDEERKMLEQRAAYGPKNPKDFIIREPIIIPLGKGIVGYVALTGMAEIIPDTSRDSRYIQDDAFRYSEISVPIILEGKVIGVIDSEHTQKNFFTLRHLKILQLSAALCANKLMRTWAETERKNNEQKLQQAQQKLSGLSLKALRAQMNPHFIFNALNAIQYFITEGRSTEALKYLSLFGRFIRKALESYDQSFLSLAGEIDTLETYLKLERMRFNEQFDFDILVSPSVDIYSTDIPSLLIQPFVERVLTEGMLNQKKQGRIMIIFDTHDDALVCTIDDNASSELRSGGMAFHSDFNQTQSWWSIQERIDLINRLFQTRIQVGLIGTRVEISIPQQQDESQPKAYGG